MTAVHFPVLASNNSWLYDLLTKIGVSSGQAKNVTDLALRPAEILIVVILGSLMAHFGSSFIRRYLGGAVVKATRLHSRDRSSTRSQTVVNLVANLWRFVWFTIIFLVCLSIAGLDLTPLLASATIIGVTFGFGAQQAVRDYMTGIMLAIEDQFRIGDTLSLTTPSGSTTGVVEDLGLRVTRLRAIDGTVYSVPNGDVRLLANLSRGWANAVVKLPVIVKDASTLEHARALITTACQSVLAASYPKLDASALRVSGATDFTDAVATLQVMIKSSPNARDGLEQALRQAGLSALAGEGLLPVPP